MTHEELLKQEILSKYRSVREFALSIDMPQKTLDNILRRGIENSSVVNVLKINKALNISTDALLEGAIVSKTEYERLTPEERRLLIDYRKSDRRGRQYINETAIRERQNSEPPSHESFGNILSDAQQRHERQREDKEKPPPAHGKGGR